MFCAMSNFLFLYLNFVTRFSEEFVKFHAIFIFAIIATALGSFLTVSAQVDSVIGQLTNSPVESFVGGISGDERFDR